MGKNAYLEISKARPYPYYFCKQEVQTLDQILLGNSFMSVKLRGMTILVLYLCMSTLSDLF